jgi:hypothetical protein
LTIRYGCRPNGRKFGLPARALVNTAAIFLKA